MHNFENFQFFNIRPKCIVDTMLDVSHVIVYIVMLLVVVCLYGGVIVLWYDI